MKKEYGRHYKAEDPSLTGGINTVNGIISKSNLRMHCNPLQILIALSTRIEQILKQQNTKDPEWSEQSWVMLQYHNTWPNDTTEPWH